LLLEDLDAVAAAELLKVETILLYGGYSLNSTVACQFESLNSR